MSNSTIPVVAWAPEPQTRGTIGLLWSCLVTIFLCTWSAVHPNLPAATDSPYRILWRRVRYLLGALLAPEMLAIIALDSLQRAKIVQDKVS